MYLSNNVYIYMEYIWMDFNTHRENYHILHFMFCITSSPYHCRTDNNILLLLLIFLLIFLLVFFIAFLAFPILVPSLFWFISIMIFLLIVFLAFTILVPSLFWFVYFKWFSVSFSVSKLSINMPPFSNSLIMLWLLLVLSLLLLLLWLLSLLLLRYFGYMQSLMPFSVAW